MFKPKIFIAGHKGMVGSALVRFFKNKKVKIITKERSELDLLNQHEVQSFFKNEKIKFGRKREFNEILKMNYNV